MPGTRFGLEFGPGDPAERLRSRLTAAEEKGFEPLVGCPTAVFKTAAFDHSATPPGS
jgi:hypothetical protein